MPPKLRVDCKLRTLRTYLLSILILRAAIMLRTMLRYKKCKIDREIMGSKSDVNREYVEHARQRATSNHMQVDTYASISTYATISRKEPVEKCACDYSTSSAAPSLRNLCPKTAPQVLGCYVGPRRRCKLIETKTSLSTEPGVSGGSWISGRLRP